MILKFPCAPNLATVALALLATGSLCSCTNQESAIPVKTQPENAKPRAEIVVRAPDVKVETLSDVEERKLRGAAGNHEAAHTDWNFRINPELSFTIVDEKNDGKNKVNGYHVWLEIRAARLELGLPITTFISNKAPKYVIEHERGHVKICRRIYADAKPLAQEATSKIFGKRFEGMGNNQKQALSYALQFAGQELSAFYLARTAGVAEKVSSKYDQLCLSEDRREQVDKTIEDAFAAVRKESAALQK